MKYSYILILFIALFGSCENELEITSPSELTFAGFWDSEDGVRAAHSGLYAAMRSKASTIWGLGELRSDIWGGNTFESPYGTSLIESNINTSSVPYSSWGGFYSVMHKINDFIQNAQSVDFKRESDKNHMLAQAYGMRAYLYFTMLKTWGDVPISLEPQLEIDFTNTSKARSPKSEVMAQIKSDIEKSLTTFDTDGSFWSSSRIYWSKAATLALKGEAYIWSGNILGGGNSDLSEAKSALESIEALGVTLQDSYSDLWGVSNEGNSEFIFAFSYEIDEATNYYSSFNGRGTEVNPLFSADGSSMSDFVTNGANRYGPSEKILMATDDSLDTRRDATFIRLYSDDNAGAGYLTYDATNYTGAILKKFIGTVEDGSRICHGDVPIYRFADVVLMLAEVKNLLGENPETEINKIRARAYGTKYVAATHAYVNSTKSDNTNAILTERLKEFIGEGKRWSDLRRAGDIFVYDNVQYVTASTSYLLQLPITVYMIGINPKLEQTEGYPE